MKDMEKFIIEKQKKELFDICNTITDVISYSQKIINMLNYFKIVSEYEDIDIHAVKYHIDLIHSKLFYQISSISKLLNIK